MCLNNLLNTNKLTQQNSKYYSITVKYGDVLCLHLSDDKLRTRKVITTFFDGSTREDILDSKGNVYYSPRGTAKVSVGKPKFFNKLFCLCRLYYK